MSEVPLYADAVDVGAIGLGIGAIGLGFPNS
jgi:hypothetical protein